MVSDTARHTHACLVCAKCGTLRARQCYLSDMPTGPTNARSERVDLRCPHALLKAVRAYAASHGISTSRAIADLVLSALHAHGLAHDIKRP